MQLLKEIVDGMQQPCNVEGLKKQIINHKKLCSDRTIHYYTIDQPIRNRAQSFDQEFTVVSIKKPRMQLNTIELAPLYKKSSFIPNQQLEFILKHQKNKSLQFKQKVYTQDYKESSHYVQERNRFIKNVEHLKQKERNSRVLTTSLAIRIQTIQNVEQLKYLLMSGSSISGPQKSIQLKTANLPPTWEVFSTLDFNRQQTIYRTMCEQIQQQMKQITLLQEKVKQNELLASQKIEESNFRLTEEQSKLKEEIQNLQSILEKKENEIQFQNDQLDEQVNYIKQLEQDVQKRMISQKNEQIIEEQQKTLEEQLKLIHQLQSQIQELNITIIKQEKELDDISNRYNKELDEKDQKIDSYENQLNDQQNDVQKLQSAYQTLNERINSNQDYQQFEIQYQEIVNEFTAIKQNYSEKCNKIRELEVAIEEVVAQNSHLIIELYQKQIS